MKKIILFALTLILAILLRFFHLGTIPNGLYSDEAVYGYNAYSILKTGKDEYGVPFPLAFKSFGDYKAPLYIYFTTPFIYLFDLNIYTVRLTSAVLGIILIIFTYLTAKMLFGKTKLSLLAAFLISISPFTLQFNRMAHENNLVAVLVSEGMFFFLKSKENIRYLYLAAVAFAASLYTYHDARVFIPLALFVLALLYKEFLVKMKHHTVLSFILLFILVLPLAFTLKNPEILTRPKYTNIFSDAGVEPSINSSRGEDKIAGFFLPSLFHNKAVQFPLHFLSSYLNHFTADFLFFKGEAVKIYNTPGSGILLLVTLPFLIFGLKQAWDVNNPQGRLLFSWFILSFVPASLTKFTPSASRIFISAPVFNILIALGGLKAYQTVRKMKSSLIILLSLTVLFSGNFAYYLHQYYINMPVVYAREWHYGMEEVINEVNQRQDRYNTVWFSKNTWGYIYPLFFMKYPPDKYQPQAILGPPDEYGFGWIKGFDKYVFDDIPPLAHQMTDVLFIGKATDFQRVKNPLYEILYPDKEIAFQFIDASSFK